MSNIPAWYVYEEWEFNDFSYKEAVEWKKFFKDSTIAGAWKQRDFASLDAKLWSDAGFDPQEAENWVEVCSLSQAIEYKKQNLTPMDIKINS